MPVETSPEVEAGLSRDPLTHRVEVFGIRHHGPGSARSLVAALTDYDPDIVLIEGPADADPLLPWVLAEDMAPPLALLAYVPDQPKIAAFWPFAVFSPEWQAMTWARRRDIEVGFCDLPAAMVLAPSARTLVDTGSQTDPDGSAAEGFDVPQEVEETGTSELNELGLLARRDPLAALAEAAGYDDPERWWDDLVESRLDGSSPFPVLTEAMAELRLILGPPTGMGSRAADREQRREAHMRQSIRAAIKRGRTRVAVVCGAWHAPALVGPLGPAAADARILRGTPKRKVTLTWVPWTHERLAMASGYGAGITSPGWYHHLWTAPDRPVIRWLTKVAQTLRGLDLPVSSAHVIEAVRLAETLATLRGRPLAGLAEVTEAARAVLCDGDEVMVRYVTDQLVVGQALGSVNGDVPTVPFEADLIRTCRTLRIRRVAQVRVHDLDLRRSIDQARSQLFHRLRLLDLSWVTPAESSVQGTGTFRETWQSAWQPEFAVAVVEAAVWGTTVAAAAGARVASLTAAGTLVELTRAVESCLLAELPETLDQLLRTLADQAALDTDVVHLMDALPALARAQRYGDVRRTDTSALRRVSAVLVVRICSGLPQAMAGLDSDGATAMRRRLDAVNTAIGLLGEPAHGEQDLRLLWLATLRAVIDRSDVPGLLMGRVVRLLADAERLSDVSVRVERALSHGVTAAAKAAWVDGFFSDGALLLIHDPALRQLLDGWVNELGDEEFVDLLPLVRRTFATFTPTERRSIGAQIAARDGAVRAGAEAEFDVELAAPALATADLILGLRR